MLADAPPPPVHVERIGRSVEGRGIRVARVGDPAAPRRVLVVGCVHGNECAGMRIVARLRRSAPPAGVQLLLVRTLNPDGSARGIRQNAHGVDLNRNSSADWRRLRGPYDSGPRPWSEPETRAIRRLILDERPALTVWYHQPLALVASRGRAARRYARMVGLPARRLPRPGSLSRWQNERVRSGPAFVVELGAGRASDATVRRHARAVLRLARG
jgi:murein peptide amidase A